MRFKGTALVATAGRGVCWVTRAENATEEVAEEEAFSDTQSDTALEVAPMQEAEQDEEEVDPRCL